MNEACQHRWEGCVYVSSRCITSQKVVASLLRREATDGRKNTECVTSQHNDVTWLTVDDARNLCVGNVLDGVSAASVLGDADIIVIGSPVARIVDDVLENATVLDSIENVGFLLGRKIDTLCITATFNVENAGVRPHMLVVTNQKSVRIRRKCRLSSSGKTEEEGDIIIFNTDVRGGMK